VDSEPVPVFEPCAFPIAPIVRAHRWYRRVSRMMPAVLVLVVGCQRPMVPKPPAFEVETQPWRFGRSEGQLLITPHYHIHTTVEDQTMIDALPRFMETAHQLYMKLLPVEQPSETPSHLYVFRTRNEWEQFTRRFSPVRAEVYLRIRSGGYAEPNGTVVYYLRRYITFAVIAHEGLHMYVYRHYPPDAVPAWLNEGLACYCEGHEWHDNVPVFTPGVNRFRMNAVRRALAKGSLFKLEEMLATDAGKVVSSTAQRVDTYYAQAWSMVAFLIHGAGGKYADRFAKLRAELGSEAMRLAINAYLVAHPRPDSRPMSRGEALFRYYLTDDLAEFSAEYGVWLRKITQSDAEPQPWRLFGLGQPNRTVPDRS